MTRVIEKYIWRRTLVVTNCKQREMRMMVQCLHKMTLHTKDDPSDAELGTAKCVYYMRRVTVKWVDRMRFEMLIYVHWMTRVIVKLDQMVSQKDWRMARIHINVRVTCWYRRSEVVYDRKDKAEISIVEGRPIAHKCIKAYETKCLCWK